MMAELCTFVSSEPQSTDQQIITNLLLDYAELSGVRTSYGRNAKEERNMT